jgi:methyl-accepting chemotaxis protein
VESGKQQTDIAEQTIRHMSENIDMSVQAFQQIVAATNQQQIGFDQVAQALKNISAATHQTAASTRQLETAAASLNALGQQLKGSVESYTI